MKILISCIIGSFICLALADVRNVNESVAIAADKTRESKPKRDASLLSGVYDGASYKYLPPSSISSSYGSYAGNVANSVGFSGGHIAGIGSGYSAVGSPIRGHNHHYNNEAFHGFGHKPLPSPSSGHSSFGYTYPNHYHGHGHNQHHGTGFRVNAGPHNAATFGHSDFPAGRIPSYASSHGYDASVSGVPSVEYKPHPLVGTNIGSSNGYDYSKGVMRSSFPSTAPHGLATTHGLNNAFVSGLDEEHHDGHVHNGAQGHFYVISKEPTDFDKIPDGSHLISTASYVPAVKQHPLPSNSYGEPIQIPGGSYNTNYHPQTTTVIRREPTYAAGHKGLGYFSFTSNKPKVLHTSGFEKPSYSKAPFKPSTFLGAKFESSAPSDAHDQQYFLGLGKDVDSTSYDYAISSKPSINYQESSYQQSLEVDKNSIHEPGSSYLPSESSEGSPNGVSSDSTGKYFPASNSYDATYSH